MRTLHHWLFAAQACKFPKIDLYKGDYSSSVLFKAYSVTNRHPTETISEIITIMFTQKIKIPSFLANCSWQNEQYDQHFDCQCPTHRHSKTTESDWSNTLVKVKWNEERTNEENKLRWKGTDIKFTEWWEKM